MWTLVLVIADKTPEVAEEEARGHTALHRPALPSARLGRINARETAMQAISQEYYKKAGLFVSLVSYSDIVELYDSLSGFWFCLSVSQLPVVL